MRERERERHVHIWLFCYKKDMDDTTIASSMLIACFSPCFFPPSFLVFDSYLLTLFLYSAEGRYIVGF